MIQRCKNAKEAWNILQLQEIEKAKSSMMIVFKSKFKNLKMEKNEFVSDFSSQLNALAQKARVQILPYSGGVLRLYNLAN